MEDIVKLLYDRRSAAVALSVSIRTIDYYLARGSFRRRRIGRKVLIPRGDLSGLRRQITRGQWPRRKGSQAKAA